jgi:hypothetical protein
MFQFNIVLYAEYVDHDFDQETIDTLKREFQNYQLPVADKDDFQKCQIQLIEIDAENYAIQFLEELKSLYK